jgi:indole-3-glycerol phosphate synthase
MAKVRPSGVPDVLARICATTLEEVARRRQAMPIEALKRKIGQRHDEPRGFGAALAAACRDGGLGLIAEIKKASPSGGLIRPEFDPAELARAYKAGGATCLSVLTDLPYFQGNPDDLKAARAAVKLPVLRKDFIVDPWQVYESRAMGADCILLIMAALTDARAVELEALARDLGMDVLAEVHDRNELTRALGLQTRLIGINNRDLRTLKTDLATTEQLASWVPLDRVVVAESGIVSQADIQRLVAAGARCFLVGESLLRQPDVAAATRALYGETPP